MYNIVEYKKVVTVAPLSEYELNEYGREGWDNYAVLDKQTFLFKRQKGEVKPKNELISNGQHNATKSKR